MTARPLHLDRAELVASVLGSTTTDAARVAEFLDNVLADRALRAHPTDVLRAQRTEYIHAGIVRALGAKPPGRPDTVKAVLGSITRNGPVHYGLTRIPDHTTVSKSLERVMAERRAEILMSQSAPTESISFQTLRMASTLSTTTQEQRMAALREVKLALVDGQGRKLQAALDVELAKTMPHETVRERYKVIAALFTVARAQLAA